MDTIGDTSDMTSVVDDVELLAILGLTSPPESPKLILEDWNDELPELSEDEDDTNSVTTASTKRKYDQVDDIFAEFDFVEVEPVQKKPKMLLIQQPFVSEFDHEDLALKDEEIQLALELISTAAAST